MDGNTGRRDLAPSSLGAASVGEIESARKCWIFLVEVPVLCGHAMTALPPEDTSIEEARAASEQSEVSSWVPRHAADAERQRKRDARIGFMFSVGKPPWRWRVECANVPSQRGKILVPGRACLDISGRAGGRSQTAGESELGDADSTLGAETCFRKTATGRWVWRSSGIDAVRCGVLN